MMSTAPGEITLRATDTAEPQSGRPGLAERGGLGRRTSAGVPMTANRKWVIGLGIALVVMLGGQWMWGGSGDEAGNMESFAVEARSLRIVLSEKGELKAKKSVDIRCEIEGRTRILSLVSEGTEVEKGDLLVELASDQIEEKLQAERLKETSAIAAKEAAEKEYEIQIDENASNIRKGELAVTIARLNLEKYREGDWGQQLQAADLDLKRAQEQLRRATDKLVDSEKLAEKNFISQLDLDDDRFREYEAQISLDKAKLGKEILVKYTNPVDLQQKESDLHEAEQELERIKKSAEANASKKKAAQNSKATELAYIQKQIEKYEDQLAKCKIIAPSSGFVVYYNPGRYWGGDRQIQEGAEVHERQTILTIPDPSVMTVVLRIHEAKVDKIQVGQKVLVEVEGARGVTFNGEITKIAMLADSRNRWLNPDLKEYETEITLDATDAELKPGATAKAEILVDQLEDVVAVPVQSIFSKSGRNYVFLDQGRGRGEPVRVELGSSNTDYVEVRSGLEAGQAILLAVSDDMKRLIPDVKAEAGPPEERSPQMRSAERPAQRPQGKRKSKPGARTRKAAATIHTSS